MARAIRIAVLLLILATTGLSLLNPLIVRNLIDQTIPAKNLPRLIWLALAWAVVTPMVVVWARRLGHDVRS